MVYPANVDFRVLWVPRVVEEILDYLDLKDLLGKWETEEPKELLDRQDHLVKLAVQVILVLLDLLVKLEPLV